jgi:Tfp pilus assembly protein PilX
MPENHKSENGSLRKFFAGSKYISNQKGVALVTGLILLVVLGLLSFVAFQYSVADISRTKDYTKTRQATYIAEAGIDRALNYFNYNASGNSPGEADNGFDDELDNTNWPAGTFTSIGLGSGGGTYSVVITDNIDGDSDASADVDNSVVLTSTGTIDNISVTLEAVLYRPLFTSQYAILSEGDIDINGNSTTITGTNGAVHSNSDVTQTGNPTVSDGASATGNCSGTNCTSGASEEFVPVAEPSDYEQYADYIFNSNGTIDQRNSDGSITTGVEGNSIFDDFSHNGQGWSVSNNANVGTDVPNQAFLYFKDDFKAQSIGSSGTPWEITLVTEKSISWTGSADITNWKDPDLSPDLQNLFLIAENDIKISGLDQNTEGLIACKDQASIRGGANIEGYIISNNLTTSDNLVNGTETTVGGGITITYNGDLVSPFLSDKVSILSWQET